MQLKVAQCFYGLFVADKNKMSQTSATWEYNLSLCASSHKHFKNEMTSNYIIDGKCLRHLCKTRLFTIQKVTFQLMSNTNLKNYAWETADLQPHRRKNKSFQDLYDSLCWILFRFFCVRQLMLLKTDLAQYLALGGGRMLF